MDRTQKITFAEKRAKPLSDQEREHFCTMHLRVSASFALNTKCVVAPDAAFWKPHRDFDMAGLVLIA